VSSGIRLKIESLVIVDFRPAILGIAAFVFSFQILGIAAFVFRLQVRVFTEFRKENGADDHLANSLAGFDMDTLAGSQI
jgi:hypothetical protein